MKPRRIGSSGLLVIKILRRTEFRAFAYEKKVDDGFDVFIVAAFVEGINYYYNRVGTLGTTMDLAKRLCKISFSNCTLRACRVAPY